MNRPPKILISAGEASGDRLGAGLARAILRRRPDAEIAGMGAKEMAEAGVQLFQSASEVAVVGIFEVLAHLGSIRRAMSRLERALKEGRPDVLVPVDFPDFNLRLAKRAARAGVPVVYFVSPQVWAWRRGRVRLIRRLVRRMLVLFPFESRFYEEAGVPVTFVGHPGVEACEPTPPGLAERLGLDPEREIVTLMPGSRRGEVARIFPRLLAAARIVRERRPDTQFVVPSAQTLSVGLLEREVRRSGLREIVVHRGDYPAVLGLCKAGVVASGTATIDAALAGLPIVVVYRMRPATYLLARFLVKVDHVAMPNLVAGSRVVPELVQSECRPDRIAAALLEYLESPGRSEEVRLALAQVRASLGGPGAYDRAAEAVLREAGVDTA